VPLILSEEIAKAWYVFYDFIKQLKMFFVKSFTHILFAVRSKPGFFLARQHRRPRHRCRRTSNVHPCEERRRSASASARDVVSDGGRGGRRAPPTPKQHVDCHFPFKA
jgi:hypothetical protein